MTVHILDPDRAAETATQDAINLSLVIRTGDHEQIRRAWQALSETLEDDPVRVMSVAFLLAAITDVDKVRSSALSWLEAA